MGRKARLIQELQHKLHIAAGIRDELKQLCESLDARNDRLHRELAQMRARLPKVAASIDDEVVP